MSNGTPVRKVVTGPLGDQFDVVMGRELPHSIEAEERLLAGVLSDDTGAAWALAVNCGVRAKSFYAPRHATVWELLTTLRQRGEPQVDIALVATELMLTGKLEEVGGHPALVQMTQAQCSSTNVRYYAEMVRLLWEMRHAIRQADKLREAALTLESRETFAKAAGEIGQGLIGLGRRSAQQTMNEEITETLDHVKAAAAGKLDEAGLVYTGLAEFDAKCKPFGFGGKDDRFVMVAAGSGHGKSVWLRQVAMSALQQGKRVLFYTREQGAGDIAAMMASATTAYDLNLAAEQPADCTARWEAEVRRIMAEWSDRLLSVVSHTEATPLLTVENLLDHARAWAHLHGPPALVVVDYLQMFESGRRFPNTEARVGYVAYALQGLQRELGCVMGVGVQLNEAGLAETREAKHDEDGKLIHRLPHRGWIRDSQQIYHAADRVIFLYVPPEDRHGNSQMEPGLTRLEVWWLQEKRRKGGLGAIKTTFERNYVRFVPTGDKQAVSATALTGKAPGAAPAKATGPIDRSKFKS